MPQWGCKVIMISFVLHTADCTPVPILGRVLENPCFFSSPISCPKIRKQPANTGKCNPHSFLAVQQEALCSGRGFSTVTPGFVLSAVLPVLKCQRHGISSSLSHVSLAIK